YLGGEDVNAVDLRLWSSSLNSYQEIIVQEELPYNTLRMMMADFDNDNDDDLLVNYTKVFDGNFGLISWYENFMELPTIAGQAYWDTNSNGQLDEGEKGLGFVQTFLEPNAQSSFTDQAGNFQYFVGKGEYQLFVQPPDSCWEATTPTALQIQVADEPIETINFGFQNVGSTRSLNTNVRSGVTRCGFQVPFWLNLVNDGCLSQNADLQLVLSDGASLISADIMPSLINQDTLSWILGQLEPVETKQFQLLLQMPGVEAIGDSISITALAYNSDGTLADTYIYKSEIRCAYDPNDKLVNPNRGGDNNYALFSETMEYTIRFQNTGNDTAFTVEIIDTIHPNLDLATLQPLNASHDFTTLIDERSRTVTFRFENILLPDSTTNEPLSHGYVSFSIESMEDLEERSIIENRAGIYFDFNPPIITNTVSNTLVTTIPVDVTSVRVGGFEGMRVGVFPNPFEDIVQLRVEAERQERLQLRVFDLLGRVVVNESLTIRKGEQAITIEALSNLPSGTYLIQLANAQQQWSDKIIKSR
ncbi:MAG: T9SS type A sorting domain-containing protein, partial [Bacteroidota bacterium]